MFFSCKTELSESECMQGAQSLVKPVQDAFCALWCALQKAMVVQLPQKTTSTGLTLLPTRPEAETRVLFDSSSLECSCLLLYSFEYHNTLLSTMTYRNHRH